MMPLAAPIGSGLGIQNMVQPDRDRREREGAGAGRCRRRHRVRRGDRDGLGCDGVLMNTAIAGEGSGADGACDEGVDRGRPRAFRPAHPAQALPPSASSPVDGLIG